MPRRRATEITARQTLGHKSYAEIPSLLRSFDVCIIPFQINDVTSATDPVKLYEYFSQGKPVISTAMQELKRIENLLYLARDQKDFLRKLDLALQEDDPGLRQQRIDFAKQNSWAVRYREMASHIDGHVR